MMLLLHGGQPHNWHDLVRAWSFEPLVVMGLMLTAGLFGVGFWRLWRETARKRSARMWEGIWFAGGWLALLVALVSPMHAWGRVLFSAHMTQHEVLMLIAAPLLVLGRPMVAFLWALPKPWSHRVAGWSNGAAWRGIWGFVSNAFVAWIIHAIVLWVWHVPALFEATVDNEWVHALQHGSFLGSALLFWWAVMHGRQRAMGYGVAVLYMFTTAIHSGLLGALLTFA